MFGTMQYISWLIPPIVTVMLSASPASASGPMEGPLLAEIAIPRDRLPRRVQPAPPDLPAIRPKRDTPRFYCAVNVLNFESLSLYTEGGKTFSFDINWGNVSHVVADEVEVIVRFWNWSPVVQDWSPFYEAPVSYNYTDVSHMEHRPYGETLEKELYPNDGGCYLLEGESHLAHCTYKVTQEVRYRMVRNTQARPLIGGESSSTGDWIAGAECEKVIEWNYTDQDPTLKFQRDTNRPGGDYRHFELSASFPESCRNACSSDSRCKAWTYVQPYSGQGSKAHCWLKDKVPPAREDDCCISGVRQ